MDKIHSHLPDRLQSLIPIRENSGSFRPNFCKMQEYAH